MRAIGKMEKVRGQTSATEQAAQEAQARSWGRKRLDKTRAHLGMLKPPWKGRRSHITQSSRPPVCVSPPLAAVVASLASSCGGQGGAVQWAPSCPAASATPTVPLELLTFLGRGYTRGGQR